jgi:hypothetical protein
MKAVLRTSETGAALVTALLVLALASGLMAGMFAVLLADQRSHSSDRDQSVAYAAAHAGLEKLTAGLASLFVTDFSPSAAQIATVASTPPAITGFQYTAPGGAAGSGYSITFTADPGPGGNTGNPLAFPNTDITTGPFEGFKGLITPYTLTVTARSATGNSEVRLRRELQTVAVPVFQFGIFGEKSLGFHAGPNFDFGGRVHTNQSLFLASGDGSTLTFRDKITAFNRVVRDTLSNGVSITLTSHQGTVSLPKIIGGAPADYRNLLSTEGSGTTALPWAGWKNLSEVTYRTNIRTEATGAKQLNLPLVSNGATPIDLIRRPITTDENVANAVVFGQRYFAQASIRILLSDRAADLTNLPTITAGAPVQLDAAGGPAGYVVGAGRPPVASSPGPEPATAATGASNTRVSVVGGGGATLTFQTLVAGVWTNGAVPAWLKWTVATVAGSQCTALGGTILSACAAHPAYAAGTVIIFTRPDLTTFVTTVAAGGAAVNSATINLSASTAQQYLATRVFFVGEDPVTCTGYTLNTLTGCSVPAAPAAIAVNDPVYSGATTASGTPLLNGFLKIEKQNAAGVWSDVTLEWMALGFAGANEQGDPCADPTPNAIIRFQRLRDNGLTAGQCAAAATNYSASLTATDFWPNVLYDAREGGSRLVATTTGVSEGGLFSYVTIDASNFRRWVGGTIGVTGNQALNSNGYIIYFSDRRGDHNENVVGDPETGEYGNEDSINPAAAVWAKTNQLEVGEDFNENNTLETYGETPHALAVPATAVAGMNFDAAARPWTTLALSYSGRGRLARPVLFRRALKIINGGIVAGANNLPASGIMIAAENPVYLKGDFNATAASVTAEPNVPAAIVGDSITLLSNNFNDAMTFMYPNDSARRVATDTGYRFAMITGKTIPFPKPAGWGVNELGSDGGVHNFMKMLENWGGRNLRYRGSMVSLYYSRQAIGIYRADANIYGAPTRGYSFDIDFLTPALLPPGTPMFRDINTLKFRQILRPNQ